MLNSEQQIAYQFVDIFNILDVVVGVVVGVEVGLELGLAEKAFPSRTGGMY